MCAWLLLGAFWLYLGLGGGKASTLTTLYASAPIVSSTRDRADDYQQPIQDVRVGQRVLGQNPEIPRSHATRLEIADPSQWREYVLSLPKQAGGNVLVNLLEKESWLRDEVRDNGSVWLDLEELGACGLARILAILPCPKIEFDDGTGRPLVTGTFHHSSTKVLDLQLAGEQQPIGVTDNHPFWSADRHQFIPASDLRSGERLLTSVGTFTTVVGKTHRLGLYDVYNLQIDCEHVYHIGVDGVLVHNKCARKLRGSMTKAGNYGDDGTVPHHMVPRGSYRGNADVASAQGIMKKHKIDLDDHKNGVHLPSSRQNSKARGTTHESVHTNAYFKAVNQRLIVADAAGGRAAVIRELQKIRAELASGQMP